MKVSPKGSIDEYCKCKWKKRKIKKSDVKDKEETITDIYDKDNKSNVHSYADDNIDLCEGIKIGTNS